jgi:WD40 repeat protein/energy-coupling factor transporter ATP-binding protein EcfA2
MGRDMNQEFPNSQQNISNVSMRYSNVTFNQTQILQISIAEIKTRQFIQTSPYKGLKKFESADKDLFFGRDQFLRGLVNELEQTNFILLLGASGSGKSSVVRAGLIPLLSTEWGSRLVNLTFTPDKDPFESFYASLCNKYKQSEAEIAREAKADTLAQVVESLKKPDEYWFILIDQFEELFTPSVAEKQKNFIQSLVELSKTKQSSVKIIGTMRADFLDRLSPYPQLVKATDKHRPLIAEMQPDELRLAIEQPAAHHGVVFKTGLVEEIIKNIQGQAGYLPLLQYTLNLLWDEEVRTGSIKDRTLNITTYHQLGGVRGALQQHIDSIYNNLTEVEKLATQKIFLKLVDIGENSEVGSEWKPVRRRALRSEFSDKLEQTMLANLINENLLVSDLPPKSQESTIEIAHEILLTSWTTLNTWIAENRHAISLRNRLNEDVANWQAKKADDELWSGSKLEKVVELSKDSTFNEVLGGFSDTANQFIDASVGLRDRQRRRTIIGLTSFSVVAFILAGAAGLGWWFTEFQRQQTITGLTTASQELFDSNKEFDALLTSINAAKQVKQSAFGVNPDMEFQVKVALQQAIYRVKEQNRLEKHKAGVNYVSFSPNGQLLASASDDATIKLWDVATGKEIRTLTGHGDTVDVVRFSPNDQLLASASVTDKTVKLWDIATGKEIDTLFFEGRVTNLSFSPDGKLLVASGFNNAVKLWDVTTRREISTLTGHRANVNSVNFGPDGKLLASSSGDNTIKLWYIGPRKEINTLFGHGTWVSSVSFSPDGKLLASSSGDNTIKLRDVATRKEISTLTGHKSWVSSVSFSPDGKLLTSSSWDSTVKLWDVATGKEISTLTGHKSWVSSVSFSPDGKLLASSSWDSTVKLWDVATGKEISTLTGHKDKVMSVSSSPDGRLLASGSGDRTIKLWDTATHKEIATLAGHRVGINSVSFSPDGRLLASATGRTIKLWDVAARKEIATLTGHKVEVISVSFSPDGQLMASGSNDRGIILWNVAKRKKINIFNTIAEVNSVRFSPDGRLLASGSASGTGIVILWNLEALSNLTLEDLLARGCDWVNGYLQTNPNISDNDKQLCNGMGIVK